MYSVTQSSVEERSSGISSKLPPQGRRLATR